MHGDAGGWLSSNSDRLALAKAPRRKESIAVVPQFPRTPFFSERLSLILCAFASWRVHLEQLDAWGRRWMAVLEFGPPGSRQGAKAQRIDSCRAPIPKDALFL